MVRSWGYQWFGLYWTIPLAFWLSLFFEIAPNLSIFCFQCRSWSCLHSNPAATSRAFWFWCAPKTWQPLYRPCPCGFRTNISTHLPMQQCWMTAPGRRNFRCHQCWDSMCQVQLPIPLWIVCLRVCVFACLRVCMMIMCSIQFFKELNFIHSFVRPHFIYYLNVRHIK